MNKIIKAHEGRARWIAIAVIAALVAVIGAGTAAAFEFGSPGAGDGQFNGPRGAAVNSTEHIIVADSGNNRIQIFSSTGGFITKFGAAGNGNGAFNSPRSVEVNNTGNIIVADSGNNRIQVFTHAGAFLLSFGQGGVNNGQFDNPSDVAVDNSNNIYVADHGNARIQVFTPAGAHVRNIGVGKLSSPEGVAVNSTGHVIAADTINNSIQVFAPPPSNFLFEFNGSAGSGLFNSPTDVAVDGSDNIYVADRANSHIQVFDSSGGFLRSIGGFGTGPGQFNLPAGVAANSSGRIIVADTGNNRIQVFEPQASPPAGNITGKVTDKTGAAVQGATVTAGQVNTTTDAAGDYTILNIVAGTYTITAGKVGFISNTTSVSVTSGTTSIVNFTLGRPGNIAGQVRNGPITPIAGAVVSVGALTVLTDINGNYLLAGIAPGTVSVTASTEGFVPLTLSVTVTDGGTAHQDFALAPAGSLIGRVIDGVNPIVDANVDTATQHVMTDFLGEFIMLDVAPGTVSVTASAPGFVPRTVTAPVQAGITTDMRDIILVRAGNIFGRVNDTAGNLLAGAVVSGGGTSVATDIKGDYLLQDIAPGTVSVTASKDGFATKILSVVVSGGTTSTLNFTLEAGGNIAGRVNDSSGNPIAEVRVSGGGITALSNSAGDYFLQGFTPGTVSVTASKAGFISMTSIVSVTAGNTSTLNFTLQTEPAGGGTTTPGTGSSSSRGGGGGGGGGATGENFTNIEVQENYDEMISKDVMTSYKFKQERSPVRFVNITGKVSAGLINTKVEVLKGTSTLVTEAPPGIVYKNVNIWVGTSGFARPANIKEAKVMFRVEKSWFTADSIEPGDLKMLRWDGKTWKELRTEARGEDATYRFFEGETDTFSPFSISAVAKRAGGPVARGPEVTSPAPAETRAAAPPKAEGAPGFEIVLAVAAICALYVFGRKIRR